MTRIVLAVLAFLLAQSASAQVVPQAGEKANCIYTVTPSSITAVQANSTTTLNGTICSDYKQVCYTLDDTSTQTVYISTHNASVSPGGTISALSAFPLKGGAYQCFDWYKNVPLWYYMKATQTPVANSLIFLFTR